MILARLKEATRSYHERIGDNPFSPKIFDGTITLGEYRRFLELFYGFYQPVEARFGLLEEWGRFGFDLELRRKAPALARDLLALGLDEGALRALPRCDALPDVGCFPRALGALYVLEGATLGGQLAARQLGPRLAIDAERGCAFFASYGPELGPMWKRFGERINLYAATRDEDETIIAAACETFERLHTWINRGGAAN